MKTKAKLHNNHFVYITGYLGFIAITLVALFTRI